MRKLIFKVILNSCIAGIFWNVPAQAQMEGYCPDSNKFWIRAEYLNWQIEDSPVPVPLVTEGPIVPDGAPVLGTPGTAVVLGGKDLCLDSRSGGRFTFGYWLDDCHEYSTEVSYLFLGRDSVSHTVSSSGLDGAPFLALPFFNATTLLESSVPIALPGGVAGVDFSGTATLMIENDMQAAEWNILAQYYRDNYLGFNWILGFRYWNFSEKLKFTTSSPYIAPPIDFFSTFDEFCTQNNFYAGQLGIEANWDFAGFFLNARAKIALGAMYEKVSINGQLSTNDFDTFGSPQTFVGGYFALPTNIGHDCRTRFAFMPETNINLGYKISDYLNIQLGYTFLYVNEMVWAGDQIDRTINPSQSAAIAFTSTPALVGVARPELDIHSSSLWAQGFNIGLEFRF